MNARFLLLLVVPLVLSSCQKKDEPAEATNSAETPARSSAPLAADSAEVRDPSGAVLATLKTGSVLEAVLGPADRSRVLRGQLRDDGKRDYAQVEGPRSARSSRATRDSSSRAPIPACCGRSSSRTAR